MRAREEEAKDMSEEQLPKEQWRRVAIIGSMRGRRSEDITTQSNTSLLQRSEVPFESQRW